jgi:hypothetical protein
MSSQIFDRTMLVRGLVHVGRLGKARSTGVRLA